MKNSIGEIIYVITDNHKKVLLAKYFVGIYPKI